MTDSITCPRCGHTSTHPVDVEEGYCGHCHAWTGTPTKTDKVLTDAEVGLLAAEAEEGYRDVQLRRVPLRAMTRRSYLIARATMDGAAPLTAVEAVSSVAIEHPEWDMDERKTWEEWEAL